MFDLKHILKSIIFLSPFIFVFSQFTPVQEYFSYFYIGKHLIMLLILILILVIGTTKIQALEQIKSVYSFFIIYMIYNALFLSNLTPATGYFIFTFISFFIITTQVSIILDPLEIIKTIYSGLLVALTISISYSIIWGTELYNFVYTYKGMRLRYFFDFYNPSYLSTLLLLLGIIHIYLKTLELFRNFYFYFLLTTIFILILLTDTRSGIISLLLFYLFINFKVLTNLIKGFILVFSPYIIYFTYLEFDTLNGITSSRFSVWIDTIKYNMQDFGLIKIFFGIGLGNAKVVGFENIFNSNVDIYNQVFHSDNFFVETFVQFGLVGLCILVLLIVTIYNNINSQYNSIKNRQINNAIFLVIIINSFFNSTFITLGSLFSISIWLLLWQNYLVNPNKLNNVH